MKRRVFGGLSSFCLRLAVLVSLLPACGDDGPGPVPIEDAGTFADAAPDATLIDGGPIDANVDVDAGECADEDGDGHGAAPCGDDCDDRDATRFPGNTEVCDADDEDCNDATFGADADGDGFESSRCCNGPDHCGADCDDALNTVNPSAAEACNGGVDDDCDGLADAADGVCIRCAEGYTGFDTDCVDIDECAMSTAACTQIPVATCRNTAGSFVCTCPAGYFGDGRGGEGCHDILECPGTDDCDSVAVCLDVPGSFTCTCPTGFRGDGHGVGSCEWNDASLVSLTPGAGARLGPAFTSAGLEYALLLAPDAGATTVTPVVAQPTRATITVAGTVVGSGTNATIALPLTPFATRRVEVVVTTETGATRTYTLRVSRAPTYFKASNTGIDDTFGTTVATSADGTRLAIAAWTEGSNATGVNGSQTNDIMPGSGAVYVFVRTGTSWMQEAYLKASNTGFDDRFGTSLSLSADGSRLAVGAFGEASSAVGVNGNQASNAARASGAVYVFARTGSSWAQEAYLKASNTNGADYFGYYLSISDDGARLAVSALLEDSDAIGIGGSQTNNDLNGAGAVYVFTRTGTLWAQEAYLKASNTGEFDQFGSAVALSPNGLRIAVGARFEDSSATGVNGDQADEAASGSGAVYVFVRTAGVWSQEAYVKASNPGAADGFGTTVAFAADGSRLAVGAPAEGSNATGIDGAQFDNSMAGSGAVYLFSRTGSVWAQEAYIKASNTGPSDAFGVSIALSADGSRLVVGAPYEDSSALGIGGVELDGAAFDSGAAYVFARAGATWSQQAYLKAPNSDGGTATPYPAVSGDMFGLGVAISADGARLLIGSSNEDSNAVGVGGNLDDDRATNSGAAYLF